MSDPSAVTASPAFSIREATVDDVEDIARLVRELALYEKAPEAVTATPDHFREALFPGEASPAAYAHVAERHGAVVGMAVWFVSFSTWTGRHGLWLEDLFVDPTQRGFGIGRALLARLAAICNRARLDQARVGRARLELPGDRVLPVSGRDGARRLDDLSGERCGASRPHDT